MFLRIHHRGNKLSAIITVILLCLFALWKIRNVLWRRKHCEIVTGRILKAEEIGTTAEFIRSRLTIAYTDSNDEAETVQLLTCNRAAASAETIELSIIPRAHLRRGRGYQSLQPDERTWLRMDEKHRSLVNRTNRMAEEFDLTDRRWNPLNLLICPALYVEQARFADPQAHREPGKSSPLLRRMLMFLLILLLAFIEIFGLFYLMGSSEGIL